MYLNFSYNLMHFEVLVKDMFLVRNKGEISLNVLTLACNVKSRLDKAKNNATMAKCLE